MAFLRIEIVGSYTSARPCLYVTHHRASQQIHPCRPGSPQVDPVGLGTINESRPMTMRSMSCAAPWRPGCWDICRFAWHHKHFDSPVQKVQKAEEKKRKVPELCRAMPSCHLVESRHGRKFPSCHFPPLCLTPLWLNLPDVYCLTV